MLSLSLERKNLRPRPALSGGGGTANLLTLGREVFRLHSGLVTWGWTGGGSPLSSLLLGGDGEWFCQCPMMAVSSGAGPFTLGEVIRVLVDGWGRGNLGSSPTGDGLEKDDVGDGGFFWSDFVLIAGGHGDEVERPGVRCGIGVGVFQIGLSLIVGVGGGITSGSGSFCAGADADAWACGVSCARASRLSGWAPHSKLGLMVDVGEARVSPKMACWALGFTQIGPWRWLISPGLWVHFGSSPGAEDNVEGGLTPSTAVLI